MQQECQFDSIVISVSLLLCVAHKVFCVAGLHKEMADVVPESHCACPMYILMHLKPHI